MPWDTSDRRQRLPADWPAIRRAVKRRAIGQCQATNHHPDCNGIGTDADHIRQGDNHSLDNLQWLSGPCHWAKTKAENAARNKANAALKRKPQEPHPGRIQCPK